MAEMKKAEVKVLDFTNVKEGGGQFSKTHQKPGEYKGKVTKVEETTSKKDGIAMLLFTIQAGTGTYPHYCKLQENQLWKLRLLMTSVGITVPLKRVKLDPNAAVGKAIGVVLQDTEYDGKMQSEIDTLMPVNELSQDQDDDEDEDAEEEEDEDDTPAPAPVKSKKKPAKQVEDDDEDLDELEIDDI